MSTTFSVTRDDIINGALRLLGVIGEGETASAEQLTTCAQAMNVMFKEWADQGYKGWLYSTLQVPFVAAAPSYLLGPGGSPPTDRPQRVPAAWWETAQGYKQQIIMVERQVFDLLTPRAQPGLAPTNAYYDAQLINGVFNVWPVPTAVGGNSLFITSQRPIEDILTGAAVVQLPQTWFSAAKWCLADEVGLEYRPHPDVLDRIEKKAPMKLKACSDLEEEQGSVVFQPSQMMTSYGRDW